MSTLLEVVKGFDKSQILVLDQLRGLPNTNMTTAGTWALSLGKKPCAKWEAKLDAQDNILFKDPSKNVAGDVIWETAFLKETPKPVPNDTN